jgi:hypothetical protein
MAGLWLGVVPLLIPSTWQAPVGGLVMSGLLLAFARGVAARSLLRWMAIPTLVALGFQGWGRVLILARPTLQQLSYGGLGAVWLLIAVVGGVLATRALRTKVMGVVAGVALLFLQGTNERYGFQGTLAPLLGCWLLYFAFSLWRDGVLVDHEAVGKLAFAAAGIFLLLQPFAATGTNSGVFHRWHSVLPGLDSDNLTYLALLAFFAKAVIFFPRWPGLWRVLLGSGMIFLLVALEGRIWGTDAYTMIAMMVAALAGWLVLGVRLGRPEGRFFRLTFWFLLYYYSTALTPRNFLDIGCMIGAVVLAARTVKWFPQRENLRADYLMLAVFGLVITGWACMRWSTSDLEWHAAYQFFSAPTVEHGVAVLVLWIAFKSLLVWIIILGCLKDELGVLERLPSNALLIIFGIKIASMVLLNVGLGGVDTLNRSYLESACVSGVLAILFLGMIVLPRAWPWTARARVS